MIAHHPNTLAMSAFTTAARPARQNADSRFGDTFVKVSHRYRRNSNDPRLAIRIEESHEHHAIFAAAPPSGETKKPPSGLLAASVSVSAVSARTEILPASPKDAVNTLSPSDAPLVEIEAEIVHRVAAWTEQQFAVLESQLEVGRLLLRAKKLFSHGKFESWADQALRAKRSLRKVLMQLAAAEAYFDQARAWALTECVEVGESARGLIALVRQYRCAIGETKARAATKKIEIDGDRLSAAQEEIERLKQQLAEDRARSADLSWKNAGLLKKCVEMQSSTSAVVKALRKDPGSDTGPFLKAHGLDDHGEIVRAVSDEERQPQFAFGERTRRIADRWRADSGASFVLIAAGSRDAARSGAGALAKPLTTSHDGRRTYQKLSQVVGTTSG